MLGVTDENLQSIHNLIQESGHLEFRIVHPESAAELAKIKTSGGVVGGYVEMPHKERGKRGGATSTLLVKSRPELTNADFMQPVANKNGDKGWTITLTFNAEGLRKWSEMKRSHQHDRVAVELDGIIIDALTLEHEADNNSIALDAKLDEIAAQLLAKTLTYHLSNPVVILKSTRVKP